MSGVSQSDANGAEAKLPELALLAHAIVESCGGSANIVALDSANSRLEVQVHSTELIDVQNLRDLGAVAVIVQKRMVQLIFPKIAQLLHCYLVEKLALAPVGYA